MNLEELHHTDAAPGVGVSFGESTTFGVADAPGKVKRTAGFKHLYLRYGDCVSLFTEDKIKDKIVSG